MGRLLEQLAESHGFEVALRLDEFNNQDGEGLTAENFSGIAVAVDFSIPEVVADNAVRLAELGVASGNWHDRLARPARPGQGSGSPARFGPRVRSKLLNRRQRLLSRRRSRVQGTGCPGRLRRLHVRGPSQVQEGRSFRHGPAGSSMPCGTPGTRAPLTCHSEERALPGIHEIGFDSEADTIRVSHSARNRLGFAHGALKAARWIMGRKGIYEFSKIWDRLG